MQLLIDLGNSRLKWAVADGAALRVAAPIDLSGADPGTALKHAWRGLEPPRAAWLAATAGEAQVDAVRAALAASFAGLPIERVHACAEAGGVRSAYAEPERLGVDRLLAMIGARARSTQAAVVVGCGTALAVDALDQDGRHLGGLIAPAPDLMQRAVLERAARVQWTRAGRILAFGTSTEDGLASGCWHAAVGLVRYARAELERRVGEVPVLWVHGGAGQRLAALLEAPPSYVADLVLEGLARLARAADAASPGADAR
jgi:type III pantothenate kinase